MTDPAALGLDIRADPASAEVFAIREEKLALIADVIAGLSEPEVERRCGDGTVRSALQNYFEEEWEHTSYANRDLDAIERRGG